MAKSFAAQLQAFAEKTGEDIEKVDRAFKLSLFGRVVRNTRVADPSTWQKPDPSYVGGQMRGNWQVTTGGPSTSFLPGVINQSPQLPEDESAKIVPFSDTWLTNNTPYVMVYEEQDAMVGLAVADAQRALQEAVSSI